MDPATLRRCLSFDIERLRLAGQRLEEVDGRLSTLRNALERRAAFLARDQGTNTEIDVPVRSIRRAQVFALMALAQRVALGDALGASSRLALVASMAVSRWMGRLRELGLQPQRREAVIRSHIEAGRVAHQMLRALRPYSGLRSGFGQLTSATVVLEFVHPESQDFVVQMIRARFVRARQLRGIQDDKDIVQQISNGIRTGAELLENMAESGERAQDDFSTEAAVIEQRVDQQLRAVL